MGSVELGRDVDGGCYEAVNNSPRGKQWTPCPVGCSEREGQIGDVLKVVSITHEHQLTVRMVEWRWLRTVWL